MGAELSWKGCLKAALLTAGFPCSGLESVGRACLLSLSLTNNDSQCKDFAWLGSYFSLGDKMTVIPCTHDIWAADSRV